MEDQLNLLRMNYKNLILYKAGLPDFPRNFSRDSIISAILMQDSNMLKDQLIFCAKKQGKKNDAYSGEEPGKIFHEYPGFEMRGLSTLYNACDTTALFLIGHEIYQKLTKDKTLFKKQKKNIINAINYIKNHLENYRFIEDPKFCGNSKFALKVTYWKDSDIINRKNNEPVYPITYSLAHIQNMRAMKSAYFLLNNKEYLKTYENMKKYFQEKLFDNKTNEMFLAIDSKGSIKATNSDSLHASFYLDKEDLTISQISRIKEQSKKLETIYGFRTLSEEDSQFTNNSYHSKTIWPFEQAIINIGAKKFNLKEIQNISHRITNYLKTNPEFLKIENNGVVYGGCDPQLWTIASKKYFENPKGIFP